MEFVIENLPQAIGQTKKTLREALPHHAEVFREVEAEMRRRVDIIVKEREMGQEVIPIVQYSDVEAGAVPPELIAKIRDRGACVIRGTFVPAQADAWDKEIAAYVDGNGLDAKLAHAAEDKYFGNLASAKPQIYGIYWSRPQVQAR
jgi:translation initiation factor 1 (eIF-1/SUI1)